jgi:hypothetical protein
MGHNPRVELCPKSVKKMEKVGGIGEKWVSGFLWKKWENRKKRWLALGGSGEERPVVVREWWVCDGWW